MQQPSILYMYMDVVLAVMYNYFYIFADCLFLLTFVIRMIKWLSHTPSSPNLGLGARGMTEMVSKIQS